MLAERWVLKGKLFKCRQIACCKNVLINVNLFFFVLHCLSSLGPAWSSCSTTLAQLITHKVQKIALLRRKGKFLVGDRFSFISFSVRKFRGKKILFNYNW